jgi:hypothetical protein
MISNEANYGSSLVRRKRAAPALALVAALVVAASASHVFAAKISTKRQCKSGDKICTEIRIDENQDVSQITLTAQEPLQGHFEVFGPGGHIANSPTALWQAGERFPVYGSWAGNHGDLWCGRFWIFKNNQYVNISGNICRKG